MDFSPDTVHLMTEEEINEHSKIAWDNLYREVNRLVGRYDPLTWSQNVAWKLRRLRDNPNWMPAMPPHILLRSVEANAAYWRNGSSYDLNERRFQQVLHVYMQHNDPLLLSFAAKDLTAMLILFDREQFQLQFHYNIIETVRNWVIFIEGNPMPKTTSEMVKRFGINPLHWVQLAYLAFAKVINEPNSRLTYQNMVETAKQIMPAEAVDAFARRTTWTREQLGHHYMAVREETPKQFHSFIRSAFLERPVLDFGQGRWLIPDPPLMIHHMGIGLYRMLLEVWRDEEPLRSEFTDSFERYVERVLDSCNDKIGLHCAKIINRLANGKSCDFILETDATIVLLECKAVAFQKNLLLPKAMQEDSSTARLVTAGRQLGQTYKDLQDGLFNKLITDRSKPVVAIVATYGEIPYVNSEWYFEKIISARAEHDNHPLESSTFGLPTRPVVMSLRILEMFIIAVNSLALSPHELIREKEAHNQLSMGEWGNFLKRKLGQERPRWLPFVEPAHDRCMESFLTDEQLRTGGLDRYLLRMGQ